MSNEYIVATALGLPTYPPDDTETPSISHEARYTLEWPWVLEYGTLDAVLGGFDPTRVLTDDDLLLVPHPDIVRKAWVRAMMADPKIPNEPTESRWLNLTGYEFDAELRSSAALAQAIDFADPTLMPIFKTFNDIMFIHRTWMSGIYVPRSFKLLRVKEGPREEKPYACVMDSHIPGADEPEEYVKAIARGDCSRRKVAEAHVELGIWLSSFDFTIIMSTH
ncbi:hypothetical protein B0H10DRAFT_2183903 [Mycena sp. CBHHK59/15]|nr:hypothetical protein B0H10DRAFT_2183903 [Mycena sp. CBHHK59/15]